MIYQLRLPAPSDQLSAFVRKFIADTPLNPDNKRWLDTFHNNTINSSQHLFTLVPTLDNQLRAEYSKFFTSPIAAGIGIMQNTDLHRPACQPPHIDRGRALAINYYIELGGSDIDTVYYDTVKDSCTDLATNYQYSDVDKISKFCFEKNNWYAYNVNRCHSVENIQTTRYFLCIVILDSTKTYTVTDLILNNTAILFDKCSIDQYN